MEVNRERVESIESAFVPSCKCATQQGSCAIAVLVPRPNRDFQESNTRIPRLMLTTGQAIAPSSDFFEKREVRVASHVRQTPFLRHPWLTVMRKSTE